MAESFKTQLSDKGKLEPDEMKQDEPREAPQKSPAEEEKAGDEIAGQPKSQAEELLSEPILIPRNPLALVSRMIVVTFFINVACAIVLIFLGTIPFANGRLLFLLTGFLLFVVTGALTWYMVHTSMLWATRTYYITERQLIVRKGIANIDEHVYELDNIRHVRLFQDVIGRQFDFGHLELLIATAGLTETLRLVDLKSPEHYESVFRNYLG
jgi:membrane protein YdbS with pleckstrin-like domain